MICSSNSRKVRRFLHTSSLLLEVSNPSQSWVDDQIICGLLRTFSWSLLDALWALISWRCISHSHHHLACLKSGRIFSPYDLTAPDFSAIFLYLGQMRCQLTSKQVKPRAKALLDFDINWLWAPQSSLYFAQVASKVKPTYLQLINSLLILLILALAYLESAFPTCYRFHMIWCVHLIMNHLNASTYRILLYLHLLDEWLSFWRHYPY